MVPDPLDPRAWNRFGYVYGNPVNFTDPSGQNPLLIAMIAGGVIGGVAGGVGYTLANPSEDYLYSPGFQRAVGAGILIGIGFGALGYYNPAIPLYAVTGGFTGGVGNIAGQISNQVLLQGKRTDYSINWTDVGVAVAVGFVVGGLTPIPGVGTRWEGAGILNGTGNVIQYTISQLINDQRWDPYDAILALGVGFGLGAWAGKAISPRGLDDIAGTHGLQAVQIDALTSFSVSRSLASGYIANTNWREIVGIPNFYDISREICGGSKASAFCRWASESR